MRGNNQQVRIASGAEVLSIKKRGWEKLKSCVRNHAKDIRERVKPCMVDRAQRCLGGARGIVKNIEAQARVRIIIVRG